MYYPDLSIIPNTMHRSVLSGKAVGWLSCDYSYLQGKTSTSFIEKLLVYCCAPVAVYFGYHFCEFCNGLEEPSSWDWRRISETNKDASIAVVQNGGKRYSLGSGEILVFGPEEIYIAPDLIYHYVSGHDYSPPDEFVQAVLSSPLPNSAEYFARMMEYYYGKP